MPTIKKKIKFLDSEQGTAIEQDLIGMVADNAYNTISSYSADAIAYPDNLIPFVDKHMKYLSTHPSVDPDHYIANLRLMTRLR